MPQPALLLPASCRFACPLHSRLLTAAAPPPAAAPVPAAADYGLERMAQEAVMGPQGIFKPQQPAASAGGSKKKKQVAAAAAAGAESEEEAGEDSDSELPPEDSEEEEQEEEEEATEEAEAPADSSSGRWPAAVGACGFLRALRVLACLFCGQLLLFAVLC